MTYSNGNQADLERIVRRALRANSSRSGLSRRVLREANDLAAHGVRQDPTRLVREIACRLSRDLGQHQESQAARYAGTVVGPMAPGGTVLVG